MDDNPPGTVYEFTASCDRVVKLADGTWAYLSASDRILDLPVPAFGKWADHRKVM